MPPEILKVLTGTYSAHRLDCFTFSRQRLDALLPKGRILFRLLRVTGVDDAARLLAAPFGRAVSGDHVTADDVQVYSNRRP